VPNKANVVVPINTYNNTSVHNIPHPKIRTENIKYNTSIPSSSPKLKSNNNISSKKEEIIVQSKINQNQNKNIIPRSVNKIDNCKVKVDIINTPIPKSNPKPENIIQKRNIGANNNNIYHHNNNK
jgi:hypothetical protein